MSQRRQWLAFYRHQQQLVDQYVSDAAQTPHATPKAGVVGTGAGGPNNAGPVSRAGVTDTVVIGIEIR